MYTIQIHSMLNGACSNLQKKQARDDTKRSNYPLGIIIDTITNDLGEVTQVLVRKGKTGQVNKLHISKIIPLFENNVSSGAESYDNDRDDKVAASRPKRKAAIISEDKTKKILSL